MSAVDGSTSPSLAVGRLEAALNPGSRRKKVRAVTLGRFWSLFESPAYGGGGGLDEREWTSCSGCRPADA